MMFKLYICQAADIVLATEPENAPNLPRMNSEDDPLNELYTAVHKTTDAGPEEDDIEEDVSQDLPMDEDELDPLE